LAKRVDYALCPKCGRKDARVMWRSKDGKTVAIQCPGLHEVISRRNPWDPKSEYIRALKRNQVFITEVC